MTEYGPARRNTRKARAIVGIVLGLLLVVGGVAGYWLLIDEPRRAKEAKEKDALAQADKQLRAFVIAWKGGDWEKAGQLTDSPKTTASLLQSVEKNLKPDSFEVEIGKGQLENPDKGTAVVPFKVEMKVPRVGGFSYASKARMIRENGKPVVEFKASVVHPELKEGQTLAVSKVAGRGKVLDRKGRPLTAASLVGQVDPQTGKGTTGLEKRYDAMLGGTSTGYAVAVTDRYSGNALKALREPGARAGKNVRTTIDPAVQAAAAKALEKSDKPTSLVALDPSNGDILAVANRPGGFNRALVGRYAPGSTFKVITSAALLERGLRPSDAMACPKYTSVGNFRFTNQDSFSIPNATFRQAFARSCNTAFVQSRSRLDDGTLAETAKAFGIGGEWDIGASTFDGSVPANNDVYDRAASTIGQARVIASPLVMASVAGTVKAGKFVQPRLVPEAIKKPYQAPKTLKPQVVNDLRSMMRSVVTEGAGRRSLDGLSGEPHAKTGTAEYGDEKPPRTHAWMIGYQGDRNIAWAVLIEDGGSGGKDAGPIAAQFLKNIGVK